MILDTLEFTLCQMQGHLFEISGERGFGTETFAKAFMTGNVAKDLDMKFSHAQWAGEAYLISRIGDEYPQAIEGGNVYDVETLFWSGYVYRYWHYYTGESSKEIYRQAPISLMRKVYLPYHTMSAEMAIDRIKEARGEEKKVV